MNARMCLLFAAAAATLTVISSPASASAPPAGAPAPVFDLRQLSGTAWSLQSMRGHVVVVNFFATWCPPCRAETPDLIAVEQKYASRGVVFVGVDDREDASLVAVFAKSKGIRYPIVLDSGGSIEKLYDVRAIPTTYILDPAGVIRYAQVDELQASVLAQALDAVLAGTPVPLTPQAQQLHQTIDTALASMNAALERATTVTPPDVQSLGDAIATGVAANKKLDALQSQPDSSAIGYFDATSARDQLNAALAHAYEVRAVQPGDRNATADKVEAALLRGQIQSDSEQFAAALSDYETAMTLAPTDTRGYDGAYLAAYEQKSYVEAARIAASEAHLVPGDPESWLTVSSAQNQLHAYDKALQAQRKALQLAAEAYAKDPTSADAGYELGRVWLKMARTQLLASHAKAAAPLLLQAAAAAPGTIVAQQATEQFDALGSPSFAIERSDVTSAHGADASPAKVYVVVRNTSARACPPSGWCRSAIAPCATRTRCRSRCRRAARSGSSSSWHRSPRPAARGI
jgi:cytochrome c biogenesis protein CcmG/thiol:disulfide interchange protein DsbE